MAKDIAKSPVVDNDDFDFTFEDADDSIELEVSSEEATTLVVGGIDLRALYQPSADRREKKAGKKTASKKRTKKAASPVIEEREMSLAIRARSSRKARVSIYRIDTSTTIRLYANRRQAELAGAHYDRDVRKILQHDYFIKLRSDQTLKLYGIRPRQVQPMADGSLRIRLVVQERKEHSYSAVYTVDRMVEIARKVKENKPSATLGYISRKPEVLAHILDCLGVRYTESEFTTLVGKLNDSIRYSDQLEQDIPYNRKNIFFSKRASKSDRLIGPRRYTEHKSGRHCGRLGKSSRIVWIIGGRVIS